MNVDEKRVKILYCAYSQVPSGFANSLAVMKQCGALNKFAELRVILIKGENNWENDFFSTYGVERFPLILLPKWMLCFREIGLRIFVLLYALFYKPDGVYSRDVLLNKWLCLFRINNIYEIHQLDQEKREFDTIFKKTLLYIVKRKELQSIVCISKTLAEECEAFGVPTEKIVVIHSGVDILECNRAEDVVLPAFSHNYILAVYVGSLQKGKGIEVILRMAEISSDINFLIIGGFEGQIKEKDNLKHIPRVSHKKALGYMKKADFLLLPMSEQKYRFHSPLKLFEYLAMGKIVIASDISDIREIIVHKNNGILANPKQPSDFLNKMKNVNCQPRLKRKIEENAKQCVNQFTWDNRAQKIVKLVRNNDEDK